MPLDMNAWRAYGAELEERAAAAKGEQAKEEEASKEDKKGVFERIAERQAEQGIDLSGEIEAEEKDYTDEEITKEADALRYLAVTTAENVGKKLENNRTAAVYHDLLEDAWQTQQDFADAGIENQGTIVTEEDVAKAKARVIEEPLWNMAAKEAGQEFIAAYADNPKSAMQSAAQGLRRTDTNINFWMTDEERLSKAKEIEAATGINAAAILNDTEAFRSAMNIYDHQKKVLALRQKEGGPDNIADVMAEVYKEFPGLEKLSYEDPAAAALALHDIHHVREARDTITAWKEAWRYGWLEQEYGILKDKEADGKATENDKARMAELEEQLKQAPETPSFFESPWLTAVSGLAGSMPMMADALEEGALWGLAGAAMGAAVSAPAGGVGAVPGFFTGGARGMVRAVGRHALGRGIASGFTWGRRIGELNNMYKAQRGQDFAEYQKMTDEFGERLLSDADAARYSQVSGAAKAAVEVAPMELFLSKFKGSPQAQKVFQHILEQRDMDLAFGRNILRAATGRGKDIAEVTLAEAGEEGVQQAIGDITHNKIEIDTGDTNEENGGIFTKGEIFERGALAMVEALPTSFLFGVIPAVASTGWDAGRFAQTSRKLEKIRQEYSPEERKTMAGTVVLAELQQVAQDSALKTTSPKTQRRLLREELSGSGLEIAYIDTGLAKEQENGVEDVKAAGRAAGLSEEAIEDTLESGGILAVPVECYAQSEASPALLETVSFSPGAEPMARMKASAAAFYEEAEARLKETIARQKRLEETITKELFPTEGEERNLAMEAMTINPDNPAQGWRAMKEEIEGQRSDVLAEAWGAIEKGLPKEEGQAGAAWYEAWKKEHGRAPKEEDLAAIAYALTVGDQDAPKVEGFNQGAEVAAIRAAAKENLDAIDKKRKALDAIKERMTELTGIEMRQTETLTGEGYRVYRHILSDLKSADNPKVTRAARISALLFARHADIYAAAMRKRGEEYADYTAMDYYNKAFALDISGRALEDREQLNQAAMYRHPAKTFSEFMEKVLNGEAGKSYYDMPLDNTLLRIYSDDVKHIQTGAHKHPLSMEEWDVLLRHLNNVDEAWRTKDTKKPRGMAVVVAFETEGKNYGAVLEFSETGIVFLKTAVAGSEKKVEGVLKINKREAGMRLHTGLPGRTAEAGDSHAAFTSHSLSLSSIQHILGIGNTPASIFEQSAWHGSPYQFSAFDLGAIGTGAGAQAHGWGLYFATDRTVAEAYKGGSLYEVEIPEDDVLLDEQKSYEKQPPKVRKALDKLLSHLTIEQLENWNDVSRLGKEKVIADIKRAMLGSDGQTIYGTLCDLTNGEKEASLLLNKYGIKGIAYEDKNAGRGFVIFDDKAISIIERYNQEAANAQMAAERLQADAKAWKETLKAAWAGKMSETQMFRVMETPLVLQLVGAKALPIYMAQKKLMQVKKDHPELKKAILNKLPEQLADPMMIFQSETVPGRIVVCLELKDEAGANIVVPVELNATKAHVEINVIASIYGKGKPTTGSNYGWFVDNVLKRNAIYINKKQAANFYQSAGLQLPMEGRKFNDLFGSSIKTDADLVKEKMKNPSLYQEAHGYTQFLSNGQRLVTLMESADESTFLHELGHVFLDDLRILSAFDEASQKELATVDEWAAWHEGAAKEYQNTPWEKEFKAHEAAILAAKKSGDAKALEKALKVWRHERFARAFERYLKEGEAPARGLKQVFRKFAAFLRSIYQAFTSDGGRASMEVERVMDRMIATDEEIEDAAQDKRYRDFTKAGGEKLLRESDKATYQRWHEKAKAEAKERLRKVITKKLERERKAQLAAERKSEEERFRAKLYEDPIYQAREAVKMAKDENAALLFYPTVEEYRAQDKKAPAMETLVEKHMEEYRRTQEKARLANAITPDEVEKAMAGTEYHDRLLAYEAKAFAKQADALRRISGKAHAAMKEVEEKIEEMPEGAGKSEKKTDAAKEKYSARDLYRAIHRLRSAHRWGAEELSAIDALGKAASKADLKAAWEKAKELLTTEHLAEQELKEALRGQSQLYRELARKEIADMTITEASAIMTFRRQEKESAARVERLIKAENWAAAEKEKQKQMMAAALVAESRKLRERVDILKRKLEGYMKGKEKLPPSEGYWMHHLAYLLRLTDKDAAAPAKLEKLETIRERLSAGLDTKASESGEDPLAAVERIAVGTSENGYLGMTLKDFEDAAKGMAILYITGRDKNKMKTMAGRTIDEIIDEILGDPTSLLGNISVTQHKVNDDEGGLGYSGILAKAPKIGHVMATAGQRYLAATMKPELIMELLGEKAHRYLYGTLERAAEKESVMTASAMAKVDEIVGAYTNAERRKWQEQNIPWFEGEMISKENILAMALNLGNEINRSRLAEGFSDMEHIHPIEEIVARVEQHMEEKDWKFVQNIWDFLGSYWPETVRIEMIMNGTELHPQPAKAFTARTKTGQEIKMKGGYYPIVYNAMKNTKAMDQTIDEAAKHNMAGAAALSTGLSSTKSRTQAEIKRRPLLLSLRVIPKHLGEVIHNQSHRIACRDVYRIINSGAFSDYVTKRMGEPFYTNLKQWAIDVWQTQSAQFNQAEGNINKLLQGLRSNAALAIMGYRMWPVVENATNIFPGMHQIGAANMLSAVGDFYANFGTYKELLHKSVFMASRIDHLDRDLKRQRRMFEKDGKAPEWLKEHAYWCMEKTDLMFSAPLWCRAYKNAFAPKLAEVMAENEAAKKVIDEAYEEKQKADALVYDLIARQKKIEEELTRRHHSAPLTEETEFSRMPKDELTAEAFRLNGDIAEAERTAAEKGQRLELVSGREIKNAAEMNKEAETRAIFAADKTVREVFGSGDVKDLASIQKGGELNKLFTMFYGYFSVQANAIIKAYYRGRSAKSWAPLASVILYRIFLTSALATLMRMVLMSEGDDDKDKYRKDKDGNKIEIPTTERILKQYAKNTLSTATGMMVGVRDIGNFYINMAFEGTDYGRGMALFGSAVSRAFQEGSMLSKLLMAREEVNEKARLAEEKRKARYDKMTARQRKKFDEEQKYRRPPKKITWLDISRSAAMTGTYLTANKFGVTDTMTNAVFSTMQYLWDDDGRYEKTLWNMIVHSAIFAKKPVKRVIPERPKKEEKRRRRSR